MLQTASLNQLQEKRLSPSAKPVVPVGETLVSRLATLIRPVFSLNAIAHAIRTTIAALLALYLAFLLKLDSPSTAMTTVLIVANPVQGMILAKSVYRIAGTLLGGLVSIILMAFFAQAPELFLLGMALWMGLCTACSTLLRGYRAYGAVLAGYTVALVAAPASGVPESIFILTLTRVAAVSLGVVTSAVVGALLTGHTAERRLERLFRSLQIDLLEACQFAFKSNGGEALRSHLALVTARTGELDDAIRFAIAETPGAAARAPALRAAASAIFGAMTALPSLNDLIGHLPETPDLRISTWLMRSEQLIAQASKVLKEDDEAALESLQIRMRSLGQDLETFLATGRKDDESFALSIGIADRLADLIGELQRCLIAKGKVASPFDIPAPRRNRLHLDWEWAWLNAIRAIATVLIAGWIWLAMAWSSGAFMVAGVIPTLGLLSARERPSSDALQFLWGGLASSLLALFYLMWVLPQISEFPLLALWLAPPLALGIAASTTPRLAFFSLGFTLYFITLLAPSNPMIYNPPAFFNNAMALVFGVGLTVLVFLLILPVNAERLKRHILSDLNRDFVAVLRLRTRLRRGEWESRMQDRLRLLNARLRAANIGRGAALRGAFDELRIGRDVLRLRDLFLHDADAMAILQRALVPMSRGDSRLATIGGLVEAKSQLKKMSDKAGDIARFQRAEAILDSIAAIYARQPRFFQRAAAT